MTKTEAEQLIQSLMPDEKLRLDELLSSLMQARQPQPSTTVEKSELRSFTLIKYFTERSQ